MTEPKAQITVRNLTMAYGDYVLMRDLNFTINLGDIFIIMGGSGCGKSTLMNILVGLKAPAKGQIFYGDLDFWGVAPPHRTQIMRRAGVMYQSGALWSSMALAENVTLPLETYTNLTPDQVQEVVRLKLALVAWPASKTFIRRRSAAGCKNGPVSPELWPSIRKSSFSANLPPVWTRLAPGGWTA